MDKKPNLVREYYSLAEAAVIAECDEEDLIHLAAQGKVQLYAIRDFWAAKQIREINEAHDYNTGILHHGGGDLNWDFKNTSAEDVQNALAAKDITVGPITQYAPRGGYQALYALRWSGAQPVLSQSISEYLLNRATAIVKLDVNVMLGLSGKQNSREFFPDPQMLVQDARDTGKLVVLVAALKGLLGRQVDLSLLDLQDDERWPEELGLAISAWLEARDNVKEGENAPSYIRKWLKSKKGKDNKPLSEAAISRIATVANWDPAGGRPKKAQD